MAVVQVAAAFVALAAVCLASPAPPVFPNQWTAFESGVVTDRKCIPAFISNSQLRLAPRKYLYSSYRAFTRGAKTRSILLQLF
eukprot:m.43213 g.43213  ORF g.43213 m.43213 type:complete len:83 (-) comp12911_c0_seq5:762-1010(-)